jgi:hypothetical protein
VNEAEAARQARHRSGQAAASDRDRLPERRTNDVAVTASRGTMTMTMTMMAMMLMKMTMMVLLHIAKEMMASV